MIRYKQCDTTAEIEQILCLQQQNLPVSLSKKEMQQQGFLTVAHDLDLLLAMNKACPHTIAKVDDTVIGYALSMHPKFGKHIPVLISMFDEIAKIDNLKMDYIVMGQICIAKAYRGKGVFRGLYTAMKQFLPKDFTKIITLVDTKNSRSIHAHKAVGFKELEQYTTNGKTWSLIVF